MPKGKPQVHIDREWLERVASGKDVYQVIGSTDRFIQEGATYLAQEALKRYAKPRCPKCHSTNFDTYNPAGSPHETKHSCFHCNHRWSEWK